MKIGTFFFKVWRWASVLLVIGALVWTYSLFPEMVAVDFSDTGLAERYVNKEHIFYIVMGLFLVNNVLIAGLVKQIPNMDAAHLPILKRDVWAKHREELNEHLTNWLFCLMAVINTIMGFSLFALATINSDNFKMDVFDFSWIYYVGMALLIVVFLLPIRLFWTPVPKDRI
ncbi:hypothetical protein DSL64_08745 [Dyadobacter luteus]|jgi:hypothetical protein|uniref:DUF1648 domain-containing protein n=1 Tax=Dyadobacter luteus TaxID=2259619 RepID=A0A3D8YCY5_9BACT|nr:hypothetical protein [Dyadobacter luteus]REA62343.1 hypothetical protein DSL64_08745 [Dyadobacter luteus]